MIGHLDGEVFAIRLGYAIVDVRGVGYKTSLSKESLSGLKEGDRVSLWTYLAVRENSQDLYGFRSEEELRFFELLQTVSGIGPKSALSILDIATVETLRSAISSGRSEYLTKVSGIGKKTAEKIVLELRDKVGLAADGATASLKGDEEALEALKALGYSPQEARDALRKVPSEVTSSNDRLRDALKLLGVGSRA